MATTTLAARMQTITTKPATIRAAATLAQELIQFPSITPNDLGCQQVIAARLKKMGFSTETLTFNDVTNLWAVRHGKPPTKDGRMVVFAGHTDVVPSGPPEQWTYPPFKGIIDENGILHGRGAVDMKGGLASFIVALERFTDKNPRFDGSIGVLLTSDEEGEAEYGTKEALKELVKRGIRIDMCIVGEPSSLNLIGDTIKVGRRGSLGGELIIHGIQGHVAYPHLAKNPVHESLGALKDLVDMHWDDGTEDFHSTTFQISNINSGTGAHNVIPGHKTVNFNFRFSPASTVESLQKRVEVILEKHELNFEINWHAVSLPYETQKDSELVAAAIASVKHVTGRHARPCTSGGTSDGRFIATTGAQVVELGPINKTIHQINEHVSVEDLETLAEIYADLLERILPDVPTPVMKL